MNRLLSLIDTRLAQGLSLLCLLCATLFAAQAQAAPTIVSPASGTTLTAATVGQPITPVTITATGGALPIDGWYECDIDDLFSVPPCLPPGLELNNNSSHTTTLSGKPTTAGNYTFWISMNDGLNQAAKAQYTLVVSAASPPVAGAVSATVAANSSNNPITLNFSGGAPTSVAVGSAPTHGTATPSGTSITYTPTPGYSGSDSFTYTGTNPSGTSAAATVTLTVSRPTLSITPASLPNGTAGSTYSQTLISSSGTAPYTYSVTAGGLPTGLSLSSAGVLSGSPTVAGTFNFTATSTDQYTATGNRAYSLTIAAPTISVSPTTLPNGTYATAYNQTISASGGSGSYSYTYVGTLPTGLSLSNAGVLSGTPTAAGTYNLTITATDGNGYTGARAYTLTIATSTLTISPSTLGNASQGSAYSTTLSTSGGIAPYTYSVTGGGLPPGITFSSAGVFSGTPTAANTYTFNIQSSDSNGVLASRTYSLTVDAATIAVSPSSLPNPVYGTSYTGQTVTASGGTAPYTFAITGGAMPVGLSLASTGAISGTPTTPGNYNFTTTATDANSATGSRSYSVNVATPSINLTPTTLVNGGTGSAYSQTLSASGGVAPYTYAVIIGSLPAGLTLSSAGTLSGTPTVPGSASFTITASDNNGQTGQHAYTLTIADQIPVAGPVSATVAANSSANPITLNINGATAASVAVSSSPSHGTASVSGTTISYTPTAGYSGADSFNYTATGVGGTSAAATVSITVLPPTLAITPATASLPGATQNVAYSQALATTGGSAPYSYSVTSGSLPAGLALGGDTISGTPTATGTSTFTITVTDANGATGSRPYTLEVQAVAVVVPPSSENVLVGQTASVDLTRGATGGPFTRATLLTVSPAAAGRAWMSGPFTLSFAPAAAFAGSAVVTFNLQNASGSVATSFVTFAVGARPDPTKDAEVIGLLNAQSRAAERFASTQMDNFNRRLEQLHRPTCDRNSFNATVRRDRDNVSLGSLGKALRDEIEGNGKGRDEDDDEKRRQERDSSRATTGECREEALAFWTDGFVNTGSNRARGAKDNSFTTYGLSAGMDYRLSPRAVVGIGFGYGNDRADIGEHDTRSEGDALGLAAYLSVNPLSEVYIDALLGYNRISFDSRRYVTADPSNGYAHGSRDADQLFASLTASYEYRQGRLSLAPYVRINSSYTKLDAYSERGGGAYALAYEEQDLRYFTSFVGLRTGYDIDTRFGVLTPRVGLAWGHNFSRNQDYRMRYADQGSDGVLYRLSPDPMDTNFMDLDTGLDLSLGRSWSLGFSYKTALGTNERNEMFRIGLDGKF